MDVFLWVVLVIAVIAVLATVVSRARRRDSALPGPRAPEPAAREAPPTAAADSTTAGPAAVGAPDAVEGAATPPDPRPGGALPAPDGSAPSAEYTIKANAGSKRYHEPDSPFYYRTRADLWFSSAADAERAGFVSWNGRTATG